MTKTRWLVAVGLMACSSSGGGLDVTDPNYYTAVAAQQAESRCQTLQRCCPKGFGKITGYPGTDVNSCIAELKRLSSAADPARVEYFRQLFASGKLKINQEKAAACNAYLVELSKNNDCSAAGSLNTLSSACSQVVEGSIAPGQPCALADDLSSIFCAAGAYCSFAQSSAQCVAKLKVGDSCGGSASGCISSGLICDSASSKCQMAKALGDACTSPLECDSANCAEGKCAAPKTFVEVYDFCK